MDYDDIKNALGEADVDELCLIVSEKMLSVSSSRGQGAVHDALEELLVSLLAIVIAAPGRKEVARRRAIHCADVLELAVQEALESEKGDKTIN